MSPCLDFYIRKPLPASCNFHRAGFRGNARQLRQVKHLLRILVTDGVTAIDQRSYNLGVPETRINGDAPDLVLIGKMRDLREQVFR